MKPDAYERNITARAFDVARYLLFWGVPTNVGQVTSIRTLEKQIQRLRSSPYAEVRAIGDEIAAACAADPAASGNSTAQPNPSPPLSPALPTADEHLRLIPRRSPASGPPKTSVPSATPLNDPVDLLKPTDTVADIVATLLYPVCDWPFRALYELGRRLDPTPSALEVLDVAVRSRGRRDDLLREFRGGQYCFDMLIDIGAYRDMHRHRRCQQYRQAYTGSPRLRHPRSHSRLRRSNRPTAAPWTAALATIAQHSPHPARHYLLPFGARSRFLFKMDFAEAEYISRVRSGVKGHFSYRKIAWEMKSAMERLEPELGRLIDATPPWIEDPLKR